MFVLVGIRHAHYPEEVSEEGEVQLALFSSRVLGLRYLQVSRLASFSVWCGRGRHGRLQFCSGSLLRDYCEGRVEECYPTEELPVDPVLVRRGRR